VSDLPLKRIASYKLANYTLTGGCLINAPALPGDD
jgi:hypothetical protein